MNMVARGGFFLNGGSWVSGNRWLWWKETRMLIPLALMLLGIAGIVFVVSGFFSPRAYRFVGGVDDLRGTIPLVFPILFAAGAGAVLVGQERETRTLEWVTGLPISPRHLIVVKMVVALVSLGALWSILLVGIAIFGEPVGAMTRWRLTAAPGMSSSIIGYPFWILHSVFLLLGGFYASWRVRNTFHSIIAVLVIAVAPILLVELTRALLLGRGNFGDLQGAASLFLLMVIPVTLALAYRAGMNTLNPRMDARPKRDASSVVLTPTTFWKTAPTVSSSWTSMVWQSVRSSPLALVLTATVTLAGLVIMPVAVGVSAANPWGGAAAFSLFLAPLGFAWLGVLVFQNDGAVDRIRFLADRGISPTKVYLMRHAVPAAIAGACLVVYAVVAMGALKSSEHGTSAPLVLSLGMFMAIAWVMYCVGQWTSQLFRSLTLAVMIGPIVAAIVLAWFLCAVTALETPVGLIAGLSCLPMLATWALMPRFMDQRERPRSFVWAAMILLLFVGAPCGFAVRRVAAVSSVGEATAEAWMQEGKTIRSHSVVGIPLVLKAPAPYAENWQGAVSVESATAAVDQYPTTPQDWIPALTRFRIESSMALSMDRYIVIQVFDRLMMERLRFESNGDWQAFSPWLVASSQIVVGLRRSIRWPDQEDADVIEIWLGDTLASESMQPHRGDDVYRQTVGWLPTRTSRNHARRRAVLGTYAGFDRYRSDFTMDRGLSFQSPYLASWVKQPRAESIVEIALAAIRPEPTTPLDDDWRRRMHELQLSPSMPMEAGPYSERFRKRRAIELIRPAEIYPARFWGMAWEQQIEELKSEVN